MIDADKPAYGVRFFPSEHHGSDDPAGRYVDVSEIHRRRMVCIVEMTFLLSG